MNLIFSDHSIPKSIVKSIFLAGPSPRELGVVDWRHNAIEILEKLGFDGTVFLPIPENRFYNKFNNSDAANWSYDNQVNWECECRSIADNILFWVPRSIEGKMPGFVTNIEFGEDLSSGKIVYGRPDNADKCKYLDKRILETGNKIYTTLEDTLKASIENLGSGSLRFDGEVYVPLFVWQSPQFKSWYLNLKLAGNTLLKASVKSHITIRNKFLFSYTMLVKIFVKNENRIKENEFIFSRNDTVSVGLIYKQYGQEPKVILVKEFRSPVNNEEGYVYELPGGSSKETIDFLTVAQEETFEEVGIKLEKERFSYVSGRQLLATFGTHKSYLFMVDLTTEEFELIKSRKHLTFGNKEDCEIIKLEIIPLSKLSSKNVDYSTIGMIYECIGSLNEHF